jgi:TetR/AcrR family transcriptional regulator of autoinduction and epiphytic fitness
VGDPVWAADQFLGLIQSFALWPQLLGGQPPPDAATRDRIIRTTVAMFLGAYPPRAA